MNGRECILTAFDHREADRVPLDFSGTRSSGISAIAYARLRAYLGLPVKPLRVYDIIQGLAVLDEDILELVGADAIELGRGFALEDRYWHEWVLPDGSPCLIPAWITPERRPGRWVIRSTSGRVIAQMPDGALYFEQTYYPFFEEKPDLEHIEDAYPDSMWTAIVNPPGPLAAAGPEGDQVLAEGAKALRAKTSRAIVGLFGGNMLEIGQFLYRNDQFLLMLAADPDQAHAFLDRLADIHLRNLERYLRLVGPYIDVIAFNDDLGMQSGPQISPRMFRQFFKLHYTRLFQRSRQLSPARIMLHTCGGIRELLPDLIEAGLESFNPVQISSDGMEPGGLKRDFGKQITFWGGGCDTQQVLPHGTPAEVRAHVRQQIDTLAPGGGFVFQQVHNIQADIPPENIVAMFETVLGKKL
jgi:uroporphyrinogen decarboxylase